VGIPLLKTIRETNDHKYQAILEGHLQDYLNGTERKQCDRPCSVIESYIIGTTETLDPRICTQCLRDYFFRGSSNVGVVYKQGALCRATIKD
jgi:hypothetical protein